MKFILSVVLVAFLAVAIVNGEKICDAQCQQPAVDAIMGNEVMPMKIKQHMECQLLNRCPTIVPSTSEVTCVNNQAGEYACNNVNLLSFVNVIDLGSNKGDGSDIWGWEDPQTGKEYAIVCLEDGTSFVDISDPVNPQVLGFLPTHTIRSIWHDAKVYNNHAFIVSEAFNHGMQVFDLTQLRGMTGAKGGKVPTLKETAFYGQFGSCHNIVINEESGFAYGVGTKTCNGGLHMVNIQNPTKPTFAGCFSADGYTHDAQCVNYNGPDTRYVGKEICFNYNEDTLTIVDVTNKDAPVMLSRTGYSGFQYTHQGWLSADSAFAFMNDELDEVEGTTGDGAHTRTMVWNVKDLTAPVLLGSFYSSETAIDHNLYVKGDLIFESNYCSGLRVLKINDASKADLSEVAYFDVAPDCDTAIFQGTWSNFPYFRSGVVVVNSIERGLFVLRPTV